MMGFAQGEIVGRTSLVMLPREWVTNINYTSILSLLLIYIEDNKN